MIDLSIIVPVFHEEDNVNELLNTIKKEVKTKNEILIVYDSTKDPTVNTVKNYILKKRDKNIYLIKNSIGNKKGVINAIKTGIKKAKGNKIVIVVADLSDDLKTIDKMSRKINQGFDVVCGSRYMRGGQKTGGPLIKTLLSMIAGVTLHLFFKIPTHDSTNTFKMYRKNVLRKINIESTGGFEYSLELIVKANLNKFKITEIPSKWKNRIGGKSNFKLIEWLPSYIKWYLKAVEIHKEKLNILLTHRLYYLLLFIAIFLFELSKLGGLISNKIIISSSLDFSWMIDFVQRFQQGYIAGKDFIFTYGPLYQIIYSFPSVIFKLPSYITVALSPIISVIVIFPLVYFFSYLVTKEKRTKNVFIFFLLFIVGLSAYSSFDLIKVFTPLLFGLIWFRYIWKNKSLVTLLIVTTIPTILGAFSYELFIYACFVVSVLVFFEILVTKSTSWKKILQLLFPILLIFIYHLLFSFLLSGGLNYVNNSVETSRVFVTTLNSKWSLDNSLLLFIFPICMTLLFINLILQHKKYGKDKLNILLILTLISLIELQSALVRSDSGHIIRAIYPSIITTFTMLFFLKKTKKLLVLGFILFLLIPYKPAFSFSLKNIQTVISTIQTVPEFFQIYKLQNIYPLKDADYKYLNYFISSNRGRVFVYPYDNYLLNINNTTYNSFPLQYYQYSNSSIEKEGIEKMKINSPEFIIMEIDGKSALDLDQTPNLTRNSYLFAWLLQNYSVIVTKNNYLILKHDLNRTLENTKLSSRCTFFSLRVVSDKSFYSPLNTITGILKKPIFYLSYNNLLIRLPDIKNNSQYLVSTKYKDPLSIAKLFDSNILEHKAYEKSLSNSDIKIIKYNPFWIKKSSFIPTSQDISISCYD